MISRGRTIPVSVVKRLTRYLTYVQDLRKEDQCWVSSKELADTLGMTSSTVRQDLSHLDFYGVSKKGYEVRQFEKVLASVLGVDVVWKMIVVGAGNLGRALALHGEFVRHGFKICGIFDSDKKKIGRKIGPLTVLSVSDMPSFAAKHKVDAGIITVPSSAAQQVTDLLVVSGIRGILNLSVTPIVIPRTVALVDSRIVASLMELTHAIKALAVR